MSIPLEIERQRVVERRKAYVDDLTDRLEKAKIALDEAAVELQQICQHEFEDVRSSLSCCKSCGKNPVLRRECKKCHLVEPVKH